MRGEVPGYVDVLLKQTKIEPSRIDVPDLAKVAGDNLLRVLAQTEAVSARLRSARQPSHATLAELDGGSAPAAGAK